MTRLDEDAIASEQQEDEETDWEEGEKQYTSTVDMYESATGTPMKDLSMSTKRRKEARSVSQAFGPIAEDDTILSNGDSPPSSLANRSNTESGIGRSPKTSSDASGASVIYANVALMDDTEHWSGDLLPAG